MRALIGVFVLLLCSSAQAQVAQTKLIIKRTRQGTTAAFASAVNVGPLEDGRYAYLTAAHTLDGVQQPQVGLRRWIDAEVIASQNTDGVDLALLAIDVPPGQPKAFRSYQIADGPPNRGERVKVVGFSEGGDRAEKTGVFIRDYQIRLSQGGLRQGDSGGPVFNTDGRVVGIASGFFTKGDRSGPRYPIVTGWEDVRAFLRENLPKRRAITETSTKPTLWVVTASWCTPCKPWHRSFQPGTQLYRKVRSNFNVRERDYDENRKLAKRLGVKELPAFVLTCGKTQKVLARPRYRPGRMLTAFNPYFGHRCQPRWRTLPRTRYQKRREPQRVSVDYDKLAMEMLSGQSGEQFAKKVATFMGPGPSLKTEDVVDGMVHSPEMIDALAAALRDELANDKRFQGPAGKNGRGIAESRISDGKLYLRYSDSERWHEIGVVAGENAAVDYDRLADVVIAKMAEDPRFRPSKGEQGPAGVVTIVIKEGGEELHRVENVPAGATVDVPVTRTLRESRRDK